jgi:hypothetical protein
MIAESSITTYRGQWRQSSKPYFIESLVRGVRHEVLGPILPMMQISMWKHQEDSEDNTFCSF